MATGSATPVLTYFQRMMTPSPSTCDDDADDSCSTSWEFCSVPCSYGSGFSNSAPCSNSDPCSNSVPCSNRVPCSNAPCYSTYCSNTIPEESEMMHFRSPLSCSTPRAYRNLTLRNQGTLEGHRNVTLTNHVTLEGHRNVTLGSPEWLRGNSAHSSASSSSESRRSQDSGFLDSIEVRRRERGEGSAKRSSLENSAQALETIFGESLLANYESPATSEQRHLVNGTMSPTKVNRLSPMTKIDNFESLNKNARSERDRNNNSGGQRSNSEIGGQRSTSETRGQGSRSEVRETVSVSNTSSQFHPIFEESRIESSHWANSLLPRGFKRLSSSSRLSAENRCAGSDSVVVKSHFENEAMRRWLYELRFETEPDCLHSLQVKSVGGNFKNEKYESRRRSKSKVHLKNEKRTISSVLKSLRHTQSTAEVVAQEISSVFKCLEIASFESAQKTVPQLVSLVEDFLKQGHETCGRKGADLERDLFQACAQLRTVAATPNPVTVERRFSKVLENFQLNFDSPSSSRDDLDLYGRVTNLGLRGQRPSQAESIAKVADTADKLLHMRKVFGLVVNHRLREDLGAILDSVGSGGPVGRVSLQVLSTVLSEGGASLCHLAATLRTVRAILSAMIESSDELERVYCLRCLATVLCVGEAVSDFDKAGGFEIIADILQDESPGSLTFKIEAVAVLTQATDPWIDLEATLTSLGMHLPKIVFSLTNLIPRCQWDEDSFLLTVAAISNLTFLELSSMEYLRAFRTIVFITNALRQKSDFSVFVLDHISTIFANMAGIERCRADIVESGGIEFLIEFLHVSPVGLSPAEVTATERLQQKSTIAISRLANEEGVASLVLQLGGVHRLVQLSRTERERNYSDGVLIAALATLRKLVSICGKEVIHQLEAEELIQPRLLDSFLLFSSRQESYV